MIWTYHGDHFEMYRNIQSLCCATGITMVLCVNYTSKTSKITEKGMQFVVTRGGDRVGDEGRGNWMKGVNKYKLQL